MTEHLDELLRLCGLVPLGTVQGGQLPSPERAWHVTAGVQTPTTAVPLVGDDLSTRVDKEWLRLARLQAVIDDQGTFLIALSRSQPWTRVRLTDDVHLSEHLVGDGARAGHAEFVTMAADGSALCGVTTEEYDVWVVADTELLHASPPPPPDPGDVDLASMSPMQLNRLFAPDRLRPPYRDGWVLLGFHRNAHYLTRLHELPESFTDKTVTALLGSHSDVRSAMLSLTDDQAQALADSVGVPVDTDRLAYYLEYQTGPVKSEQSTARRLSP
ncbi:hypothetical protein [Saccharothrix sp. ST-888]|uniref:hypothetical protein n=1 Tax=Saccharothrix sp. ST-888 TaxID=1427391 RepID=UPI0012E01F66|nr:hypothetical protein [Saccharothrix sp. ST-888]